MSILEHEEIEYYDWIVDGLLRGVQRQTNGTVRKAVSTARYINREFVARAHDTVDRADALRHRYVLANERAEALVRESERLLAEYRLRARDECDGHHSYDADGNHDGDGDGHHDGYHHDGMRGALHGHRVQGR